MSGALLLRGMLVGLLAGVLCFGFLRVFGEPPVARAIALEAQASEAARQPGTLEEPELVSRPTQAGIGLFTGVAVYSTAFGGLFALAFAVAYGRAGRAGPRTTAALLALCGFVALYLVPTLKYPANPPSIGEADTIGQRTALYFIMMALSLAAMAGAAALRRRLVGRLGAWDAALAALAAYVVAVGVVALLLPGVDEVPEGFPATLLWQFRVASLGAQALMWAVIGLGFGALTQRATVARRLLWVTPAA